MARVTNPFKIQGFQGREYFCDRETELQDLISHLLNDRNVVLHAWRRLGKTALLNLLKDEIEKTQKANVIYVDFLGSKTLNQANGKIINAVYQHFGTLKVKGIQKSLQELLATLGLAFSFNPITFLPEVETSIKSKKSSENTLNEIGKFLNNQENLTTLILDEFQEITKFNDVDAEPAFRFFAQTYPKVRIIFSGSERNLLKSMFTDKNRPFYKSTQLMGIEPIPLNLYNAFIQNHFGKRKITIKIISDIYSWARGQTYTIQLQCNRLFELNKSIEEADLHEIRESLLKQEAPVFANYSNLLSDGQFNLLKAIAKDEAVQNPQASEFLLSHNLGAASTVRSALKSLINKELVIKEANNYLVHDVLFARWLQRL